MLSPTLATNDYFDQKKSIVDGEINKNILKGGVFQAKNIIDKLERV